MKLKHIIFLAILVSVNADAAPADLFSVKCETDLSAKFLANIFGSQVFSSICKSTSGATSYLPEIFRVFNLGLLVFAGGFISYSAVSSTLGYSSDGGNAGGKSNPWVPLRLATGATLLTPVASGYSLIQLIVLWAVIQGVGLANHMWYKQVDLLTSGLPAGLDKNVKVDIKSKLMDSSGLFYSNNNGLKLKQDQVLSVPRIYAIGACLAVLEKKQIAKQAFDNSTPAETFGVYDDCGQNVGEQTFCAGSSSAKKICGEYSFKNNSYKPEAISLIKSNVQQNILYAKNQVLAVLGDSGAAQDLINDVNCIGITCRAMKSIYNNLNSALVPFLSDNKFKKSLTYKVYSDDYTVLQLSAILTQDNSKSGESWANDAKSMGWISGGQYYYKFNNQSSNSEVSFNPANYDQAMPKVKQPFALKDNSGKSSDRLSNEYANNAFPTSQQDSLSDLVSKMRTIIAQSYVTKSTAADSKKSAESMSVNNKNSPVYKGALRLKNEMVKTFKDAPMNLSPDNSVFRFSSVIFPTDLTAPLVNMMGLLGSVASNFTGFFIRRAVWVTGQPPENFLKFPTIYGPCRNTNDFSPGCKLENIGLVGYLFSYFDIELSNKRDVSFSGFDEDLKYEGSANIRGAGAGAKTVSVVIDPLTNIANIGRTMLRDSMDYWFYTLQAIYETSKDLVTNYSATKAAMAVGSGLLSAIPVIGGALGGTVDGISGIFDIMFSLDKYNLGVFLPIGIAISGVFFVLGIVLGIYIPLVPFMVFSFTAIGWLISVIEAMIAAPLVALGVTHPQGHDLLGKAEQSVILLLGIFIRPSAIVLGFIAAVALLKQILLLVNIGFLNLMITMFDSSATKAIVQYDEILTRSIYIIGILIVYVYILLAAVNQVFSLVYQVPEKLLRWIGAAPEQSGVAQMMGEVKQGVQSSGQQLSQGGQQMAGQKPEMDTVDTSGLKKSGKTLGKAGAKALQSQSHSGEAK